MAETLVIVESPSKAKTIEKYLGSKYRVIASNGHVRDLPKSQLGVDVEHDFEPKYITLRGRGEVIEKIRKEAKHAKHIVLGLTQTSLHKPGGCRYQYNGSDKVTQLPYQRVGYHHYADDCQDQKGELNNLQG